MGLLNDGQIIRDTYEVERFLGEGAFAEVYRVKHRFLGRQAMKVFKTIGMNINEVEHDLEEAIILSSLGHRNIIRVYDANITDTLRGICGFFTMEYVAGGSLEQFWRSFGNHFVPVKTAVEILHQTCLGLDVAHREKPPIIHRDIKPQNILVGYDAGGLRVRVSDFGLAKRVNPMTLMASAKGTFSFKPPEVFSDFLSDSCAGDVWALGSVLYLLLTDRLPYPRIGEMSIFDISCFEKPIIAPSRLNYQVDPMLDQIIFKALALKPENRYKNAKEFMDDIITLEHATQSIDKQQLKSQALSQMSKTALGLYTPAKQTVAENMAVEAIKLAREAGKLVEAADMMEEAFNKWPNLRQRYENQVKIWRKGISL